MKVTLRLQFITAYLLLVICIFALINTYGYSLTYNYLETKKEQQISSEAYYLTSHYASTQGTPEDGAFTLQKQSSMLSSLFDTRVWLVSPTGTILSDSSDYDYVGKNITDSDSDFLNRQSGGVHLHTLRCPDRASFERIRAELDRQGLLYRRELREQDQRAS